MNLSLKDRVVVITGAASGIGAALALNLAARGAHLALLDRDAAALEAVAATTRQSGGPVHSYTLDLTDRDAIRQLPGRILADLGAASVLINNAGIALAGTFEQVPGFQFDQLFAINFFAAVEMTRSFLPQLRQSRPAQIVNLSSVFGIIGVPGQVAYCASKFAVRGFSEALRGELADSDIGVTVVHPGGVKTNIAVAALKNAGLNQEQVATLRVEAEKPLRMDPRAAAEIIVRGLERRQRRILVGSDARIIAWTQRLLPVSYGSLLQRLLGGKK